MFSSAWSNKRLAIGRLKNTCPAKYLAGRRAKRSTPDRAIGERCQPALTTIDAKNAENSNRTGRIKVIAHRRNSASRPGKACDRVRGRGISRVRQRAAPRKRLPEGEAHHMPQVAVLPDSTQLPCGAFHHRARNAASATLPPAWRRLHLELTSRELTAEARCHSLIHA